MFSKHKGNYFVESLLLIAAIIVFVYYISIMNLNKTAYNEGTDIPVGPNQTSSQSAVMSTIRNAKAAGEMFLKDNADMTFAEIVDVWPGLNVGNTSFDMYMDNTQTVKALSFLVVPDPDTGEQMLFVGTRIGSPELANRIIGLTSGGPRGLFFGPTGFPFTVTDGYVYMRVK